MFNMFKSTAALVLLLGAVSSLPAPPPASVIDNTFFIFGTPPGWGKGPDVEGRGRFGCDNPHPYCKKDNHPKEACTDWGEAWKGWMEENCPKKCGKCGGGGGGPPPPPPPPGPSAPGKGAFAPPPGMKPPPGPKPGASCNDLKDKEGRNCKDPKSIRFCDIDSSNGKLTRKVCAKTCCENKEDLSGCNQPADKDSSCRQY